MTGQHRTRGFSAIELLIIIAALAILVALGVIAFLALAKARPIQSAASAKEAATVQNLTLDFYNAYTSKGNGAQLLQQYGTANLIAASKSGTSSFSPIVCAANVGPVSVGTPTYADGRYKVPVTMRLTPPVTFTAELVKDGSDFKIDKVDCPPAHGGE